MSVLVLALLLWKSTLAIVCPHGWTYFHNKCWWKSALEASWPDADDQCRNRYSAALASVQSKEEDEFVSKLSRENDVYHRMYDSVDPMVHNCFTKVENAVLLGAAVMSPSNSLTPEQCLEQCLKSSARFAFTCRSALWYRESHECVLNNKTRTDEGAIFVEEGDLVGGIDFFDGKCSDMALGSSDDAKEIRAPSTAPPAPVRRKEHSTVRNCFTKYRHSSLVGFVDHIQDNVTERECLATCWRCSECLEPNKEACKSVTYYSGSRQCIMSSASRKAEVEYFDQSEPLATFFERRRECTASCEDKEVALIFAVDVREDDKWTLNDSLSLVDRIVSGLHETTEFWRMALMQIGTDGPAIVEFPLRTFPGLGDMRKELAKIEPAQAANGTLRDTLADAAQFANAAAIDEEVDAVWLVVLTSGRSEDSLDDFAKTRSDLRLTVFATGIGEELNFPNLEKIASSKEHLIHAKEPSQIVAQMTRLLCAPGATIPAQGRLHRDEGTWWEKYAAKSHRDVSLAVLTQQTQFDPHESVWIGLNRDDFGRIEWTDGSRKGDYEKVLLRHMEIGPSLGDCVAWLAPTHWTQSDCATKRHFVCSIRPVHSINEKLEHDFGSLLAKKAAAEAEGDANSSSDKDVQAVRPDV